MLTLCSNPFTVMHHLPHVPIVIKARINSFCCTRNQIKDRLVHNFAKTELNKLAQTSCLSKKKCWCQCTFIFSW